MRPLMPLPREWVERLFARLAAMYGSRFADMWDCVDPEAAKETWAAGLAGYTGDELTRGLDACRARDWPPTMPEFARLCRPLPSYEAAFYEAVEQMRRRETGEDAWSHPAVYWAAVAIGTDLRSQSYSVIKGRWHQAMDRAMADVAGGVRPMSVPSSKPELPTPGQSTPSREFVRSRLDEMHRIVGGGK